jgi:N6-L-threonylcarbamoyladenine synthase
MESDRVVLGIESSCDETAAAVVDSRRRIRANVILSQHAQHSPFRGVVPELAARSHAERLDLTVREALRQAACPWEALDAVAATAGPGLLGGVLVGTVTAKCIALVHDLPYVAVNHLEAHALTPRLTDRLEFPYLALLVSGGHSQFVAVAGVGQHVLLGTTRDDAAGEAFDKAARLLGLGFPGGPAIERASRDGNPDRFPLPRPLAGRAGADMSFSGLKTALVHAVARQGAHPLDDDTRADLAASFQKAVVETLAGRLEQAVRAFRRLHAEGNVVVLAGGVAANQALRARLSGAATGQGMRLVAPPVHLCTDNAAMVAWAGIERLAGGAVSALEEPSRARWPLAGDPV